MKNNNFDLLRLIAAFQVLFSHTIHHLFSDFNYEVPNSMAQVYNLFMYIPGVPIFFLISGFLIALSYERNSNLIYYVKNRILRIYPALYINMFFGVLILYYFGFVKFNGDFYLWLIAQMSIVQFYNAEMFREFGVGVINGSLWTISVELTFYIILPILFYLYKKSQWIIVLLFISSFTLGAYDITTDKEIFFNKLLHISILPYLFLFIIGIGFYKFYNNLKHYIEEKFLRWLIVFIIFTILIEYLHIHTNIMIYVLKSIIYAFMVFSFAFSFRGISKKILKGNDYTYGVYIYHMLIINIFVHFKLYGELQYLVYVLFVSLICGILSWHLIEKPFLKLKEHSLFKEMHKNV